VFNIIDKTITGGFRTDVGTTPMEALSGEHSSKLIPQFLVSAKEISDLTGASTDVTG